ncbi:hypothetical protein ACU19_04780 [Actinobaculum suis]|uniref:hypothetical protein n=1 Tax=Actinobaculum suis TaxID=1657 RepID=UPI00066FD445|nr:hypothetical protein [Actinobaculum suis]KMY23294.1 hypothetical protein ACU19_04780 [Actinobaculum suis]
MGKKTSPRRPDLTYPAIGGLVGGMAFMIGGAYAVGDRWEDLGACLLAGLLGILFFGFGIVSAYVIGRKDAHRQVREAQQRRRARGRKRAGRPAQEINMTWPKTTKEGNTDE